jgi:DMSO/TMAO reductase YedYZ molybdopterin-dependent catalytic subunit
MTSAATSLRPRFVSWRACLAEARNDRRARRRGRGADMTPLPPGQYETNDFPRFGLTQFARRFPKETTRATLHVRGDVEQPVVLENELGDLPRVEQSSDFHCVTTWTRRSLSWAGVRFTDLYERVIVPRVRPRYDATFVILRCQDGFAPSLPLCDLLARDVLLADTLDGRPLSIDHGAPLRLVAPAHYGYKNAKHLTAVEFWRDRQAYRRASFWFMDHPRARVAFEERGRGIPGWLLRYLYRPLVGPTVRQFQRALAAHAGSAATRR